MTAYLFAEDVLAELGRLHDLLGVEGRGRSHHDSPDFRVVHHLLPVLLRAQTAQDTLQEEGEEGEEAEEAEEEENVASHVKMMSKVVTPGEIQLYSTHIL